MPYHRVMNTQGQIPDAERADLLIIGGGINGCGLARDAAGRGLRVVLAEQDDLASGTSSAATKLLHGGLRYLEYFDVRLVRESLREREILLRAMPHIARPMRFVLPLDPAMRFDGNTPAARLLARVAPWLRGRRPNWLIRLGLWFYDHLGGRSHLPGTRRLNLRQSPEGAVLRPDLHHAFEYSDGWVDDARLVALNAADAARRGALVLTRWRVTAAERHADHWRVTLTAPDGAQQQRHARVLVNAAGPWLNAVQQTLALPSPMRLQLVRGSHLVTRRLYDHDKCYFLQGRDGRIVFLIPYEDEFTLIGTTDMAHAGIDTSPEVTEAEVDYLLAFVNAWLRVPISRADVRWQFAGLRPLIADGQSASAASRDFVLHTDRQGATLLQIQGGKITTYRYLAEQALRALAADFPAMGPAWTARTPLPGGDFARHHIADRAALVAMLKAAHPHLPIALLQRLARSYGTHAFDLLAAPPGQDFGGGLQERELRWLCRHEFAQTAEDVLWRRSKLGLHLTPTERAAVAAWFDQRHAHDPYSGH